MNILFRHVLCLVPLILTERWLLTQKDSLDVGGLLASLNAAGDIPADSGATEGRPYTVPWLHIFEGRIIAECHGAVCPDPSASLDEMYSQLQCHEATREFQLLGDWNARTIMVCLLIWTGSRQEVHMLSRRRMTQLQPLSPIPTTTCDYCNTSIHTLPHRLQHGCATFYTVLVAAAWRWHIRPPTSSQATKTKGALLREHQLSKGLVSVFGEAYMLPAALGAQGTPYSLISPSALWAQTEPAHRPTRVLLHTANTLLQPSCPIFGRSQAGLRGSPCSLHLWPLPPAYQQTPTSRYADLGGCCHS